MKHSLIIAALAGLLLSSCRTSQVVSYTDDVYANPKEEKNLARLAAQEKEKKEALERQQKEEALAAQKAKDDANPYYKDPSYSSDDYYDYEYASRINRFHNPIGVGYYDSYYTNMYFYNQNPNCWGTSIYYNWGMPSTTFYNYGLGISTGWGYGYNAPYYGNSYYPWYTPYYDPWYSYNNPWGYGYGYGSGWGYNNYWNGYRNGYHNGYLNGYYNGSMNSGWQYFNALDANSGYGREYGPRGSNGGGNNPRRTSAGMEIPEEGKGRREYVQSVLDQQNNTPRFSQNNRRTIRENDFPNYTEKSNPTNNSSNKSGNQGNTRRRISENGNQGNSGWNNSSSNNNNNSGTQRRKVYEDKGNSTHSNDNNSNTNSRRGGNDGWNSGSNSGNSGNLNRGGSGGSNNSSPRNSGTGGGSGGGGGRRR